MKKPKKNGKSDQVVVNKAEKAEKVEKGEKIGSVGSVKTEMVVIDEKIRQKLLDIQKQCNDLAARYQLILETFLNAKGLTGKWQISGDTSVLIKVESGGSSVETSPAPSGGEGIVQN